MKVKKVRVKNYCICEVKDNVIWIKRDCPATLTHNGKGFSTIIFDEYNWKAFKHIRNAIRDKYLEDK